MFTDNLRENAEQLLIHCRCLSLKISTAESCTGGLIASCITSCTGSSSVFERGYITYSNEAKEELLDVSLTTLQSFGAVSEEVAIEMAEGALINAKTNLSLAVTGVAGPGGGTSLKPVGLVFIACASEDAGDTKCQKFNFPGNREEIRLATVEQAILLGLEVLRKNT